MESEIELALRAIVPSASASPTQIMDAVVQHTVAAGKSLPHRRRRHAARRHGAYVRLRELEQSRQYNLQLDVIDLQRQIAQLQQLREMLEARSLNRCDAGDGSFVRTAMVYYDFAIYDEKPTKTVDACAYLATVMTDDVRIGRFVGRRNILPMMKRYATYFDNNTLQLTGVRILTSPDQDDSEVVVRTTGAYGASLTMYTIEQMFPHIATGGHDKLVRQLLAKPLEGESTFDFVFDRKSRRVVRFVPDLNFLPAFLRLVPDPSQLAFLFSQAKITEEMFIGDVDEYDADRPASPEAPPASPSAGDETDTVSQVSTPPLSSVSDTERVEEGKGSDSPAPSRNLKMADLLSPEGDDDKSARMPSLYYA
jgi:hypothetical protein